MLGPDECDRVYLKTLRYRWRNGGKQAVLEHCEDPEATWGWQRFERKWEPK